LNHRLRSSTIAFIGSAQRDAENIIARTQSGAIPDGYGPGNHSLGNGATAVTIWTAPRGRDTLSVVDVRYAGMRANDLSSLQIGGNFVSGGSWGYSYNGRYDSLGVARANGATLLALNITSTRSSSTGRSEGASQTHCGSATPRTCRSNAAA